MSLSWVVVLGVVVIFSIGYGIGWCEGRQRLRASRSSMRKPSDPPRFDRR